MFCKADKTDRTPPKPGHAGRGGLARRGPYWNWGSNCVRPPTSNNGWRVWNSKWLKRKLVAKSLSQ